MIASITALCLVDYAISAPALSDLLFATGMNWKAINDTINLATQILPVIIVLSFIVIATVVNLLRQLKFYVHIVSIIAVKFGAHIGYAGKVITDVKSAINSCLGFCETT